MLADRSTGSSGLPLTLPGRRSLLAERLADGGCWSLFGACCRLAVCWTGGRVRCWLAPAAGSLSRHAHPTSRSLAVDRSHA